MEFVNADVSNDASQTQQEESSEEVETSPSRTRRERRPPLGGLTIDELLTPLSPSGTASMMTKLAWPALDNLG